jgi:hypothetical protein
MTNITNQKPNKGTMTPVNAVIQTSFERPRKNLLAKPFRSSGSALILIALLATPPEQAGKRSACPAISPHPRHPRNPRLLQNFQELRPEFPGTDGK